jgi:endonuclease G, mitochondrial
MNLCKRILLVSVIFVAFFSCRKVNPDEPTRENNLVLGNPSNAGTDDENNYLLDKPQFTLSYNRSRGTANWVSWHLSQAWKGEAQRQNNFRPDNDLPASWGRIISSDYTNSGFDRGHLCPSDDRDGDETDNAATFLLTNIFPQNPNNNQQTWRFLEEYCRKLAANGNELYLTTGVYGTGGENENDSKKSYLGDKKVTVPARIWKVILILPNGLKDLDRINSQTRVIAVDMPNEKLTKSWGFFRVNVDSIEEKTGLDLFARLPKSLQEVIESKKDVGATQ